MRSEVSQQNLAECLGISVATVSRALGDHKGINPMTRAKVLKAAADLGYRGELKKRESSFSSKAIQIGVLLPNYVSSIPASRSAAVFLRMLAGITAEARRQNVSLGVDYLPADGPEALASFEKRPVGLRDGSWQGCIFCGNFPREVSLCLSKTAFLVQISNYEPHADLDCICHDDGTSCEMLVERLWSMGHRRIAYLGETHLRPSNVNRAAATAAAMLSRCGNLDSFATLNIDGKTPEPESFDNAIAHLKGKGFTAWICLHDDLGYRFLSYLKAKGIRCPEDVSVCGFDNFEPPSDGLPKLASVNAPFEEMGSLAVLRLLAKLKGEAPKLLLAMVRDPLVVEGRSIASPKAWRR